MSQVTSTKPSQTGTFGAETKQCLYCGSTMRKLDTPIPNIEGIESYYCPNCGFTANFIKKGG